MKLISDLFSQRGKVAPIYPQRRKSQIKKKGQQQSAWKSIASEIFYEYADNTKLNGFYYLKRNVSKGYVRVIWTLVPVAIFLFGALLVFELVRAFFSKPTVMIIDRPELVRNIPFPGVTLCHPQTVIDHKARSFVDTLILPDGADYESVLNSMQAIPMFVEFQWDHQEQNEHKMRLADATLKLNNYTIPMAVDKLGMNCKDIIKVCAWSKREFPCFQNSSHFSFVATTSFLGLCCSFNYHPDDEAYEPFYSPSFGVRGGLSIIGSGGPQVADGKSGALFSSGLIMLIHHPLDVPVEGNVVRLVEIGHITSVAVYPTLSYCADEVLALSARDRRCLQASDVVGDDDDEYRQTQCNMECLRHLVYTTCKCHPFYMPIPLDGLMVRHCEAIDAACYAEHMREFKSAACPQCMPSCREVTYMPRTYVNEYLLDKPNYNVQPMYKSINSSVSNSFQFTSHIYLASQMVRVQKQIMVSSVINLMSNFGGIFNLCLGISILTVVEALFHLFRIPRKVKEFRLKQKAIVTSVSTNTKDGLQIFN